MLNNYALIIGVESYRAFDPDGSQDVRAALPSARAWYRTLRSKGYDPANIRFLTSPILSADSLGHSSDDVTFGEATREEILEGFAWMNEKLEGGRPASGVIVYIGHGMMGDHGAPWLCPTDLDPSLRQIIDLGEMRKKTRDDVKDDLTLILDACHAEVEGRHADHIRGRLGEHSKAAGLQAKVHLRALSASSREGVAYTATFLGEPLGAFTWAMTSALDQWSLRTEEGVGYLDVTHRNLLRRVRTLLDALDFAQTPEVTGPSNVGDLALFQPGIVDHGEQKSFKPTAALGCLQLDGGWITANNYCNYPLTFHWIDGVAKSALLANVYVTASSMPQGPSIGNTTMQAGEEYWEFANAGYDAFLEWWEVSSAQPHITIGFVDESSDNISADTEHNSYFKTSQSTTWSTSPQSWPQGAYSLTKSAGVLRGFGLKKAQGSSDPGTTYWVQTGTQNLSTEDLKDASLAASTTMPSSTYMATSTLTSFNP